ncbi:hypothetical protein NDU88_004613 [Pleurodeles waltl]|uniref:Uncharacterized protein n=1 Tax=Pleurodeles waltl TaxID=8319 RepID=A0AAV7TU28_PLEWA|nr:hypothetical protein NDU88_004613 [Pleurodeles waltl]
MHTTHRANSSDISEVRGTEVSTDDPSVEGCEDATTATEMAVNISAEQCNTPTNVPNAPETTEDIDVGNEGGSLTPGPQISRAWA